MNAKKLWILFLVLCVPAPAFSAGNLHIGMLQIHPFVSVQETYNDNIFAVPNNTTSDWITTITPGIKLALPTGRHLFTADYRAVIDRYSSNSSENTTDHYANAMADLKFGRLFGLKVSDSYIKGHEPRISSTSGEIEKYTKHAPSVSGTYQLADRSKIQLDYTRAAWDYELSGYRSRKEDLASAYFYYRFLPRTSAFVEYDFRNYVYDQKTNGLDSKVNSGSLGLTWEMSAITKGTVKAGYLDKRFEVGGKDDFGTWTASVDVIHAFSDYASIKLVALRDVNESAALNTRYYITTGAFGQYTHKLSAKISGVARLSYGVDDYSNAVPGDPVARKDKTTVGGLGLRYQMQDWLEFALDYDRRHRDSNLAQWDLDQNTYALTVTFAL